MNAPDDSVLDKSGTFASSSRRIDEEAKMRTEKEAGGAAGRTKCTYFCRRDVLVS